MGDRDHDEDGVEELADEIIVAQQTDAHAPAPRAKVTTDHPSVVIATSASVNAPTVPPLRRSERTEKTVVIRDRKSLERLRREASRRPSARRHHASSRAIYLVGFAVLASLAAGTLLAAIANSSSDDAPATAVSADATASSLAPAPSQAAPEVVDLEDLPVVKQKKKKKPSDE